MKQQVFFIHGGDSFSVHDDFLCHLKHTELRDPYGRVSSRWTRTLHEDLGEDFEVFTPHMPNAENAKYEEWKIWFERHFEYLHDGAILLGWSLGGMFLLKYLSEEPLPFAVKYLGVIASPAGYYEIDTEPGNDCLSFQFKLENLVSIHARVPEVVLYHSEDDFVVPYEHVLKLKEVLTDAVLVSFTDRNHFLQPEFPELLEKIRELSKTD